MSAERTSSQRGRASRNKGASFERALAKALRPWWPEAVRSRDNGFRTATMTAPDSGDLAGTGPGIFWSAKDDLAGDMGKPSVLGAWFAECQAKAEAAGRLGLLVQKRRGHAGPLQAWCWLAVGDLVALSTDAFSDAGQWPVRVALADLLPVLVEARYTCGPGVRTEPERTGGADPAESLDQVGREGPLPPSPRAVEARLSVDRCAGKDPVSGSQRADSSNPLVRPGIPPPEPAYLKGQQPPPKKSAALSQVREGVNDHV